MVGLSLRYNINSNYIVESAVDIIVINGKISNEISLPTDSTCV